MAEKIIVGVKHNGKTIVANDQKTVEKKISQTGKGKNKTVIFKCLSNGRGKVKSKIIKKPKKLKVRKGHHKLAKIACLEFLENQPELDKEVAIMVI